jgi:hypothetical protein
MISWLGEGMRVERMDELALEITGRERWIYDLDRIRGSGTGQLSPAANFPRLLRVCSCDLSRKY